MLNFLLVINVFSQELNANAISSDVRLQQELNHAKPGSIIRLPPGFYSGAFQLTQSGTKQSPIQILGEAGVVIDCGSLHAGIGFYLKASFVHIEKIKIQNCKKGLVIDAGLQNIVSQVTIESMGEEGLHLRMGSQLNVIANNHIFKTGLVNPGFGEGIYIGSAKNHWCDYTKCLPDHSDMNIISENLIENTSAESIDVKEGTQKNIIQYNIFQGDSISGKNAADSFLDIKGNYNLILSNVLKVFENKTIKNAMEVHAPLSGWGIGNQFKKNKLESELPGFGLFAEAKTSKTLFDCDNDLDLSKLGISNIACEP